MATGPTSIVKHRWERSHKRKDGEYSGKQRDIASAYADPWQALFIMTRDPRRLNMEDVARLAGVSRSTVSRVLNNDSRVSDAARQRVREVMSETGYHPNAAARSLARQRSGIIGLVFPRVFTMMFSDPWASVLIRGCLEGCEQADLNLVHVLVSTDDDAAVDRFIERSVTARHLDGVILASHVLEDKLAARLEASGFPHVLVGRNVERDATFVDIDNRQAARVATGHLLDHGYRDVMHLMGPPELLTALDRREGFWDAFRERGLDPDRACIEMADYEQVPAYEVMSRILRTPDRPEAVFAANDAMAIGAIRAAYASGLEVPGDIAVIGFDDIDMNRLFRPQLTTVRQPSDRLGRAAVDLLTQRIANPSGERIQRWLTADLIVRGSCGCAFSPDPSLTATDAPSRTEWLPIDARIFRA